MSAGRAVAVIAIAVALVGALDLRPGGVATVGADPQVASQGRDEPGSEPRVSAMTPDPNQDCQSVNVVRHTYADRSDPTITNRAEASVLVLVASVEAIEPGRWNTGSGERPAAVEKPGPGNPDTSLIYRPVSLRTQEVIRGFVPGTGAGATISVRWVGGQAGCDFVAIDSGSRADLVKGDRYVFFLGPSVDADGQPGVDLMILEAWPISADDRVATPLEGDVPLATLAKAVVAAPAFDGASP